jgi:hypothetical protein
MSVVTVDRIFGSGAEGSLMRHKRSSINACPLDLLVVESLDTADLAVENVFPTIERPLVILVFIFFSMQKQSWQSTYLSSPYHEVKATIGASLSQSPMH